MKKKISPSLTLMALAISAFAIGSTEFISVGLLPMIVSAFHVSLAQAGLTVSLYALGVTIGAPILTIMTGRMNRRHLMVGIMLLFIAGNLLAAFAPAFWLLLAGRLVSAFAHGIFMSVSTVIAADVVAPHKRASAIAIMFTGLTVATVTGVPLGTFIGQQTSWHMSFLFIAFVGLLGLIANYCLIPSQLPVPGKTDIKGIWRIFTTKSLVLAFLITALGYGGTFAAYTYLSPILARYLNYSDGAIVILLTLYGVMVAIGNTLGGKLANRKPLRSLLLMFGGLTLILFGLYVSLFSIVLGTIMVLGLGLFAFMNVPGLQLYVVQQAEQHVPQDIALASAFNISAFNIGIYLGSTIGALVTAGLGLRLTPLFGAVMVFFAVLLTALMIKTQARPA